MGIEQKEVDKIINGINYANKGNQYMVSLDQLETLMNAGGEIVQLNKEAGNCNCHIIEYQGKQYFNATGGEVEHIQYRREGRRGEGHRLIKKTKYSKMSILERQIIQKYGYIGRPIKTFSENDFYNREHPCKKDDGFRHPFRVN